MSKCGGLKIPEDDSKVPEQDISERNERTSSRQCVSACIEIYHAKEFWFPFMKKNFEVFSIFNFSE